MQGTIKSIKDKGFGFIRTDKGKEYFFHNTDFQGHWLDLQADDKAGKEIPVEFDAVESNKGLRAGNVRRLDWPNQHP